MLSKNVTDVRASERRRACDALEQQDTKRVEVRTLVDFAVEQSGRLGREVASGSDPFVEERPFETGTASEAEVDKCGGRDIVIVGHDDVRRFDVAVKDS